MTSNNKLNLSIENDMKLTSLSRSLSLWLGVNRSLDTNAKRAVTMVSVSVGAFYVRIG